MAEFVSEGIRIAYEVRGEGKPVILVHGFGSNQETNWVATSWVQTLNDAGYSAVTLDNRGHGASEKLYDPDLYPARLMAHDVANLIDHLDLGRVPLLGYSMGSRISAFAAMDAPDKVEAVIFGGLGINMVRGLPDSAEIVAALEADRLDQVTHPTGRQFRIFADHTKSDRKALAACMKSSRDRITPEQLQQITVPALVAVGGDDETGGDPHELAELLPQGEAFVIERRDHMRATGDPQFKKAVLDFLSRVY